MNLKEYNANNSNLMENKFKKTKGQSFQQNMHRCIHCFEVIRKSCSVEVEMVQFVEAFQKNSSKRENQNAEIKTHK